MALAFFCVSQNEGSSPFAMGFARDVRGQMGEPLGNPVVHRVAWNHRRFGFRSLWLVLGRRGARRSDKCRLDGLGLGQHVRWSGRFQFFSMERTDITPLGLCRT